MGGMPCFMNTNLTSASDVESDVAKQRRGPPLTQKNKAITTWDGRKVDDRRDANDESAALQG
eukprot:2895868-Amphidinium_carterae.1